MTKVVKCHNCSSFGLTEAVKIFKCRICGVTKSIDKKKIYFEGDARECSEVIKRIREEEVKMKEGRLDDNFRSAG